MNRSVQRALEDFRQRPRPLSLRCGVQHYAWGDRDFIPDLLGIENRDRKPYAELWIGAHPDLPSVATIGRADVPLHTLIEGAAEQVLGRHVAGRFERQLPFLVKILSCRQPLSIQAHPNKQQAREGFQRENRLSVALNDPSRNYHDEHHKPELISALTDFYALRGFRPLDQIAAVLNSVPEFQSLASEFRPTRKPLVRLYTRLMRMAQAEVDAILKPLLHRLREDNQRRAFTKQQPEYWTLRADAFLSGDGHQDRGLFSIYLLNLVHLLPGQALYLAPGELHAYLEGTGLEIMANSNNVLRGGLTPKHVDVEELLKILTFDAAEAEILRPSLDAEQAARALYRIPAEEFSLSRLRVTKTRPHRCRGNHGVHVGIVMGGRGLISTLDGDQLERGRGDTFLVPQGLAYQISSNTETLILRAGLPGE